MKPEGYNLVISRFVIKPLWKNTEPKLLISFGSIGENIHITVAFSRLLGTTGGHGAEVSEGSVFALATSATKCHWGNRETSHYSG